MTMTVDEPICKYAGMMIFRMQEKHPFCGHQMAYFYNTITEHNNLACIEPSCQLYWKTQIEQDIDEKERQEELDRD
jgi:hypothetical protein